MLLCVMKMVGSTADSRQSEGRSFIAKCPGQRCSKAPFHRLEMMQFIHQFLADLPGCSNLQMCGLFIWERNRGRISITIASVGCQQARHYLQIQQAGMMEGLHFLYCSLMYS